MKMKYLKFIFCVFVSMQLSPSTSAIGQNKIIQSELPTLLRNRPYQCSVTNKRNELQPGFAPYKLITVRCLGLDPHVFHFAVCREQCQNPRTKEYLDIDEYKPREIWLSQMFRVLGEYEYRKFTMPIACKCTNRTMTRFDM